jgi:phosphate-selective porin
MKNLLLISILTLLTLYGYSQSQVIDSLKEVMENHQGKLNALDERVLVNEGDLAKLNKIKLSGYVQAQWENYEHDLFANYSAENTSYIRRARVKFTYEATDGIKFVLQPDFSTGNVALKDAYAVVNIPKLNGWTIWAGQMNRINYEVEYSSSSREVMERSLLIRSIYPGEREIGAKLEYSGTTKPFLFQLMVMNGNFTGTNNTTVAKDIDSRKDLMGRFVYSIKMPSSGIGIDLGVNGYYGGTRANKNIYVKNSDLTLDSISMGDYLNKQWVGGEFRLYADILGGLSLKGEYIAGTNSLISTTASPAANASTSTKLAGANIYRNFAGYYIYLVKNIGNKNQAVIRYDFFDPNTKISGDKAGSSDINYKTLTLAWQYYLNDFIRITVQYAIVKNEKSALVSNYMGVAGQELKDNVFGIRVQAKF